jgi:hypothetical protein
MSGYDDDIRLERRHASTIAGILGKQFIKQDVMLDLHEATDFATFTVAPFKVAARLRTHGYLSRYGDEFTLRWCRPSGVPTEIDKVRAGLVDYMIYGFVSEDESRIVRYFIGDFSVFLAGEPDPVVVRWNTPPDSQLAAYRLADTREEFVVKAWPDEWARRLRGGRLRSRTRAVSS